LRIDFTQPTILYGGSFDPVHEGHLHVAREALAALPEVKQFVFVPAAHSPGKAPAVAPPERRLAWLRLAAEPLGFRVWDREVAKGGESYTVDTVEAAHAAGARRENLYWLLGADAYAAFPRWRSPERIRTLCRLLVVDRPGQETAPLHPSDRFVGIPLHPASSTALRARLAAGDDARDWLPPGVRAALDKLLPGENPYATTKS
jgi:nicotinate-nucleotide adenylyltransferase